MKTTFLKEIANYISNKHESNLSDVLVLMPNRRSCLYFEDTLTECFQNKTVLLPEVISFKDWINKHSELTVVEEFILLFELYQTYCKVFEKNFSFDDFFYMGKILLNDFNEIDSELVDAQKLFSNINDLEIIKQTFSINEELNKIFKNYLNVVDKKQLPDAYYNIWTKLFKLYTEFHKSLKNKKISYDGFQQRFFLEHELKNIDLPKCVYAVGFNALTNSEKEILKLIENNTNLIYLWDYDEFYVNNELNTAGLYLREWLKKYPNPKDFNINNKQLQDANIVIYEFSNEAEQVKFLPDILQDIKVNNQNATNFVIVLANESLLPIVLNTLPDFIPKVNVTMGYSLKYTQTYNFLNIIYEFFARKANSVVLANDLLSLLYHPFMINQEWAKSLIEKIKESKKIYLSKEEAFLFENSHELLKIIINNKDLSFFDLIDIIKNYLLELEQEISDKFTTPYAEIERQALEKVISLSNDFIQTCKSNNIKFENKRTGLLFYLQLLRDLKVDLIGEPIEGLQVMGLMETRLLDFENVIILSLNEDYLPKNYQTPTFILQSFRNHFGLTTITKREAVDAYHFYRLLQRGNKYHLCYVNFTNGKQSDKSPYLRQLLYNDNLKIKEIKFKPQFNFQSKNTKIEICKKNIESEFNNFTYKLKNQGLFRNELSNYIICPLKFAFANVLKLNVEEIFIESKENIELGNILHDVVNNLFKEYVYREITRDDLQQIKSKANSIIEDHFSKQISTVYAKILKKQVQEIIKRFIDSEIEVKKRNYPITVELSDDNVIKYAIQLNNFNIELKGKPDLILKNNEAVYVIDFKLSKGNSTLLLNSIEETFSSSIKYTYAFQLLYYCFIYAGANNHNKPIYAENILFSMPFDDNKLHVKHDNSSMQLLNMYDYFQKFEQEIKNRIKEILDEQIPFKQTDNLKNCNYCDFNVICKKI